MYNKELASVSQWYLQRVINRNVNKNLLILLVHFIHSNYTTKHQCHYIKGTYRSLLYPFIYIETQNGKASISVLLFYCFGTGKALYTHLYVVESQCDIGKVYFYCVISCNKCQSVYGLLLFNVIPFYPFTYCGPISFFFARNGGGGRGGGAGTCW